jgi:hypothetical protein
MLESDILTQSARIIDDDRGRNPQQTIASGVGTKASAKFHNTNESLQSLRCLSTTVSAKLVKA